MERVGARKPIRPQENKRKGYFLAGQMFPTKRELTEVIREILWRYGLGAVVAPKDEILLLALLQRHPHAAEKIGVGVKRIRVQKNPVFTNTRGFFIERLDGSSIDFSYVECIRPSSLAQQVSFALRRSVERQILERKQRAFGDRTIIQCPITDKRCTWEDMHVDHRPPLTFVQLSKDFLTYKQVAYEDVALIESPDGVGKVLGDLFWEIEWQDHHRMFADLWVISIAAHVELTRKRLASMEE